MTDGKAVPKMTAELLPVRTEAYSWALLLCAFRNATLVTTATNDTFASAVMFVMVKTSELFVKA